jgi:phenylalanyl-tRNA synthetase beta chain
LDFDIVAVSGDAWTVLVPTYRVDVVRDVDVAEELLRIYGFNNVEVPEQMRISVAKYDPRADKLEKSFLDQLTGNGFFEIMNNSLSKGEDYAALQNENYDRLIEMLNPLSQDLNVMRSNLLFGGLQAISFNQKRQQPNLRFFERGKTYGKGANGYYESECVDLIIAGKQGEDHWSGTTSDNDFFALKGLLESASARFNLNFTFTLSDHSLYGEYVAIKVDKTPVGHMGTVHPKVLKHFDVKGGVAHASLDWRSISNLVLQSGSGLFSDLPKFPSVRRDLALLVNESTTYSEIEQVVMQTERKMLKNVFLFDVYEGKNLPAGKKSYAIGMTFQDKDKTLNDKAVEKSVQRILGQLVERTGAELR